MNVSDTILALDLVFAAYPKVPSSCIETLSDATFFISDDIPNAPIGIKLPATGQSTEAWVEIANPNSVLVAVWKYDGCFECRKVKGDRKPQQCEAILFDDAQFVFLEMKLNAITTKERGYKNNRKDAFDQLEASIKFVFLGFQASGITKPNLKYRAVMATPPHFPNQNASINDHKIALLIKYQVPLEEYSSVEF